MRDEDQKKSDCGIRVGLEFFSEYVKAVGMNVFIIPV